MSEDKIKEIFDKLANYEKRLCLLEASGSVTKKKERGAPKKTERKKKGSTGPVADLLKNGFFKELKSTAEVQVILKKRALSFEKDDLAVTLMRLVRKGILERDGDGKKILGSIK